MVAGIFLCLFRKSFRKSTVGKKGKALFPKEINRGGIRAQEGQKLGQRLITETLGIRCGNPRLGQRRQDLELLFPGGSHCFTVA